MKRLSIIMATVAILFASCQKDETPAVTSGDGEVVTFISGIATRASGTEWANNDEIGVFMTPNGGSSNNSNVQYKTTTSGTYPIFTAISTSITYPHVGDVDFLAYYPYKDGVSKTQYGIDVSKQEKLTDIDLMIAKKEVDYNKRKDAVELQFFHKLSNIIINTIPGKGMSDADLSGMTVQLMGIRATANYNLSTDAIDLTGNNTDITLKSVTDGKKYEGIIIPQGIDNNKLKVKLITKGEDVFITDITISEFKSGKNYTYTATIIKETVITKSALGAGQTIEIDLGSEITINEITWDSGKSLVVSKKEGTTYNFEVPANINITTWTKTTTSGRADVAGFPSGEIETGATSDEDDPDAIPTFTAGTERKFVGTTTKGHKIVITQEAGVVNYEYYGRYGTAVKNGTGKDSGHSRKRAVITTADAGNMNWAAAEQYCKDFGEGWYLPTQNQLAGAWVAHNALLPFSTTNFYWSSTENFYDDTQNWHVSFSNGLVNLNYKTGSNNVRCVRDL